jgi:hypothetical protein
VPVPGEQIGHRNGALGANDSVANSRSTDDPIASSLVATG